MALSEVALGLSHHADENRLERPVILAVDQITRYREVDRVASSE